MLTQDVAVSVVAEFTQDQSIGRNLVEHTTDTLGPASTALPYIPRKDPHSERSRCMRPGRNLSSTRVGGSMEPGENPGQFALL